MRKNLCFATINTFKYCATSFITFEVNPVRNSSPAIAGLETERGIISNGVKEKFHY